MVAPRNELDVAAQQQFPTADTRRVPASMVAQIASVEGVARADGDVEAEGVYVLDKDGKVASSGGAPGLAFNWTDYPAFDGSIPVTLVQGSPQPDRTR